MTGEPTEEDYVTQPESDTPEVEAGDEIVDWIEALKDGEPSDWVTAPPDPDREVW